jgi:hypothetical protein
MGRWGKRWPLSTPQALTGPAGSRRVGGRYVSSTSGRAPDLLDGKVRFKSRYERNYARFLNYLKIPWQYERRKFIFHKIQSGTRTYTPDFYLPEELLVANAQGFHRAPPSPHSA